MTGRIAFVSFTDRGAGLAERLRERFGGTASNARRDAPFSLAAWTAEAFASAEALVFVGAAGIAVRAIAPHIRSKAADPAVIVADEAGRFVVPILSGHLGGANALARELAAFCGGTAVLTTATDVNNRFAVDEWAKRQNCAVVNPDRIKYVSANILAGKPVSAGGEFSIRRTPPDGVVWTDGPGCDFYCGIRRPAGTALHLAPKIAVLGAGCRRGTPLETLEAAFLQFLEAENLCAEVVCAVSSIDLKKDEPGLLAFCKAHGWPLKTGSAEVLAAVPGAFTASEFVRRTAGVDNVCERSAVWASGGVLAVRKRAWNGVTLALALGPYNPDWRWQDE